MKRALGTALLSCLFLVSGEAGAGDIASVNSPTLSVAPIATPTNDQSSSRRKTTMFIGDGCGPETKRPSAQRAAPAVGMSIP